MMVGGFFLGIRCIYDSASERLVFFSFSAGLGGGIIMSAALTAEF